jgi:hypothetical protein
MWLSRIALLFVAGVVLCGCSSSSRYADFVKAAHARYERAVLAGETSVETRVYAPRTQSRRESASLARSNPDGGANVTGSRVKKTPEDSAEGKSRAGRKEDSGTREYETTGTNPCASVGSNRVCDPESERRLRLLDQPIPDICANC